MLTIRLQRVGKRNRPEFRLIVAPKTAAAQKKFTQVLGSYNPRTKQLVVREAVALSQWLSRGVELSPTAHNLLVSNKLLPAGKVKAFRVPKKTPVAETATAVAKPSVATSLEAVAAVTEVAGDAPAPAVAE